MYRYTYRFYLVVYRVLGDIDIELFALFFYLLIYILLSHISLFFYPHFIPCTIFAAGSGRANDMYERRTMRRHAGESNCDAVEIISTDRKRQ